MNNTKRKFIQEVTVLICGMSSISSLLYMFLAYISNNNNMLTILFIVIVFIVITTVVGKSFQNKYTPENYPIIYQKESAKYLPFALSFGIGTFLLTIFIVLIINAPKATLDIFLLAIIFSTGFLFGLFFAFLGLFIQQIISKKLKLSSILLCLLVIIIIQLVIGYLFI